MSQVKGKEAEWTYNKCCCAMFPCCMCTFAYMYVGGVVVACLE